MLPFSMTGTASAGDRRALCHPGAADNNCTGSFIKMAFVLILACLVMPALLTVYNFAGLFREYKNRILQYSMWILTLVLGAADTGSYLMFLDVELDKIWSEQLYNAQLHQPLWTGGWLTLGLICLTGILGAALLTACNVGRTPPLLSVLCMAAMYLLLAVQVLWCLQMMKHFDRMAPCLVLPMNIFFIAVSIIRKKIREWNENELHSRPDFGKTGWIRGLNRRLMKAEKWPLWAFVFAVPMLGLILLVLILLGQEPDAFIRAWTNTADWTLSQQTGPQNLFFDEHYLCTAAAGGHRKIVKPVRMGVRRGHRVIVNRQLMIANAFENVLEERMPAAHSRIRRFYDRYGFPLADLIRTSKAACDIVYLLMKPAEWFFLAVLYLVDPEPENRIAVQYMPGLPAGHGKDL